MRTAWRSFALCQRTPCAEPTALRCARSSAHAGKRLVGGFFMRAACLGSRRRERNFPDATTWGGGGPAHGGVRRARAPGEPRGGLGAREPRHEHIPIACFTERRGELAHASRQRLRRLPVERLLV